MREIKFRAWDDEEKKFWYFELNYILERQMAYKGSWDDKILKGNKTQYIGTSDINKKDIYEKDILRYTIIDEDSCCGRTYSEIFEVFF